MSKVVIQGNASGTGDFTIAAPNSNTDRTLTLPDETGELVVKGQIISTAKDTDFTAYSSSNTNGVLNNNNNTSFTPQRSDTTVLVFVFFTFLGGACSAPNFFSVSFTFSIIFFSLGAP